MIPVVFPYGAGGNLPRQWPRSAATVPPESPVEQDGSTKSRQAGAGVDRNGGCGPSNLASGGNRSQRVLPSSGQSVRS